MSETVSATSTFVVPIDLEKQAQDMDVLCAQAAPDRKFGYLALFTRWKQRLGPYYARYQQLLYDVPVQDLPESERAAKLQVMITQVEAYSAEQMQALQKDRREAREVCEMMSEMIAAPENDKALKRFVEETEMR
ncbi:MAG: hypothetical protein KKE76_07345 [Gammaproteobacteria bacterium]|nr:hypothetical protein [Gammaproteobacteria bacterium]